MLLVRPYSLSEPHATSRMRLRTLQEAAIAAYSIVHSILCSSMEF